MNLRLTYRTKLLLNFLALFAIFTALLVMFQHNREKQYKRDLLEQRLESYADVVAKEVENDVVKNDTLKFQNLANVLPSDLRLTVINNRGQVMFESLLHSIKEMDNHLHRPEVQMALHNDCLLYTSPSPRDA